MKKTLFTILTLLLSALFLITACDSPQGRVQEETTDPTETTAGNDITQAENADTEPTNATTTTAEPYETVDPDLIESIRTGEWADAKRLEQFYPNIFDIPVKHRPSDKDFEALYATSNDDYKTLDELIKIIGKPHSFHIKSSTTVFVWLTLEGNLRVAFGIGGLGAPSDISKEERLLYFTKFYVIQPKSDSDTRDPNTTITTPETTREKAPETTAEPYETVDPDLLYEIRNSPFADEAWLKQEFPNIIDAEITYRAPEQKFESLFSASNDDYKTLDELIKIVGKPHGYTNRTGVVLFVWITAEGNPIPGYVYTMTSDLPEDVSFEERHLHYSKIYIQKPQSAPESRDPSVTTATPETTREKAPETTAGPYVETTTLAP